MANGDKGVEMIPVGPLSQREFVARLRDLVDFVRDPERRYQEPEKFAESYARIIRLATLYPENFSTKYVIHNLGQKRIDYIRDLLEGES
jgi:hypothetical protein